MFDATTIGLIIVAGVIIVCWSLISRFASRPSPQLPRDDVSIQEWRGKLYYGEGKSSREIATSGDIDDLKKEIETLKERVSALEQRI